MHIFEVPPEARDAAMKNSALTDSPPLCGISFEVEELSGPNIDDSGEGIRIVAISRIPHLSRLSDIRLEERICPYCAAKALVDLGFEQGPVSELAPRVIDYRAGSG